MSADKRSVLRRVRAFADLSDEDFDSGGTPGLGLELAIDPKSRYS